MGKIKQISLTVTGMSCAHCEKRVTVALMRLDGVKDASASARENRVTVSFDADKVGVEQIRETILDTGYTPQ